jgi:hypothetical protein
LQAGRGLTAAPRVLCVRLPLFDFVKRPELDDARSAAAGICVVTAASSVCPFIQAGIAQRQCSALVRRPRGFDSSCQHHFLARLGQWQTAPLVRPMRGFDSSTGLRLRSSVAEQRVGIAPTGVRSAAEAPCGVASPTAEATRSDRVQSEFESRATYQFARVAQR